MKNVNENQMVIFYNPASKMRICGVAQSVYMAGGEELAIVSFGFGGGSVVESVDKLQEPTDSEIAAFHRENDEVTAMAVRGVQMMENLNKCEAAAEREDGGVK